jgi:1,4-dihydroxy-2-naphthoate octaprenyltransferase
MYIIFIFYYWVIRNFKKIKKKSKNKPNIKSIKNFKKINKEIKNNVIFLNFHLYKEKYSIIFH